MTQALINTEVILQNEQVESKNVRVQPYPIIKNSVTASNGFRCGGTNNVIGIIVCK